MSFHAVQVPDAGAARATPAPAARSGAYPARLRSPETTTCFILTRGNRNI